MTQHCLCSRWMAKTPGASSMTHNTHYSMRAMVVCPATTLPAPQSRHQWGDNQTGRGPIGNTS